jgi:hypothetical protein
MSGYTLVEQNQLASAKEDGLTLYSEMFGLLDFLRELAQDEFSLPRFAEIRLIGLEEVLFAAQPEDRALALEIHRHLQRAASHLERRQISIQVVFQGKLQRGDTLWVDYRGARLPISVIFDSPIATVDPRGNRFYRVHFNLTSPAA